MLHSRNEELNSVMIIDYGPNLCRVNKVLVPHLMKIYFGLGWPSSVLEIVSSQRLKTAWIYLYP